MKPTVKNLKYFILENMMDNFHQFLYIRKNHMLGVAEFYYRIDEDIDNLHVMYNVLGQKQVMPILKKMKRIISNIWLHKSHNETRDKNWFALQARQLEGEK